MTKMMWGNKQLMFATVHPELVEKIISLDSLRYPFPTKNHIPILSIRGNDTKADPGVLPKSGALLISLSNAKHIDLCDRGPKKVKQQAIALITAFIESHA
jgi:hypothetical protein